jgi:hypothetical protein
MTHSSTSCNMKHVFALVLIAHTFVVIKKWQLRVTRKCCSAFVTRVAIHSQVEDGEGAEKPSRDTRSGGLLKAQFLVYRCDIISASRVARRNLRETAISSSMIHAATSSFVRVPRLSSEKLFGIKFCIPSSFALV